MEVAISYPSNGICVSEVSFGFSSHPDQLPTPTELSFQSMALIVALSLLTFTAPQCLSLQPGLVSCLVSLSPTSYSRTPFSHAPCWPYSLLALSLMSPLCLWPAFEHFSLAYRAPPPQRPRSLWLQQLPPPTFPLATHPQGHTLESASPKSSFEKLLSNHSSEWLLFSLCYCLKTCCQPSFHSKLTPFFFAHLSASPPLTFTFLLTLEPVFCLCSHIQQLLKATTLGQPHLGKSDSHSAPSTKLPGSTGESSRARPADLGTKLWELSSEHLCASRTAF